MATLGQEQLGVGGDARATSRDSAEGATTTLEVTIADFAFTPSNLAVSVGDTVTWTNTDSVPHTVTQNPSGSGFQSGTIASGESFSFTFEEVGEFTYFCEFHPNMTGTIVVTE